MRSDSRHKSLNGIRQLADAAGSYPGLLWLLTGTPEFFDSSRGVQGLTPLHERIQFIKQGRFASLRQAQLELTPFDNERLRAVALRLRELFPTADRPRLERCVSDPLIARMIADVTAGFRGDVGVVPRQFLRQLVTQMDLVEENDDYDPSREYQWKADQLTPEEQRVQSGLHAAPKPSDSPDSDEDADFTPIADVW